MPLRPSHFTSFFPIPTLCACAMIGVFQLKAEEAGTRMEAAEDDTFLGVDAIVRDEPEPDGDEAEYYRCPSPEALPFDPASISLSDAQASLLVRALNAVARDFPSGRERDEVPLDLKQMAIALVLRLDTHNAEARLAEYLLRRNRVPEALPEAAPRNVVAAKLWNAGFGLHRYAKSEDDRMLAACVLDLALRFDADDPTKLAALAELSLGDGFDRWENVTVIPDLDIPIAAEKPIAEEPVPTDSEAFAFAGTAASITLFTPTEGERFPRLDLEILLDPAQSLPLRKRSPDHPIALDADSPGLAFSPLASTALERARGRLDERLPEWRKTGAFLHYTLVGLPSPDTERSLGPAALILAEALASGKALDPSLAVAGTLGTEGKPLMFSALAEAIAAPTDDSIRLVALPAAAGDYLGDFALLGNPAPLLARQYLSYRTLDELAEIVPLKRPLAVAAALETFGEIQSLAQRMTPAEILANRHVQERLRDIVAAVPNHLSASHLLAAALERAPSSLTLPASIAQLRGIEQPLRELIRQRLNPRPEASAPGFSEASALFSASDFALRKLRPVLHPDTQAFANGLTELIDDLRVQIRADASRSAVFLQEALDSLEVQVAQFEADE